MIPGYGYPGVYNSKTCVLTVHPSEITHYCSTYDRFECRMSDNEGDNVIFVVGIPTNTFSRSRGHYSYVADGDFNKVRSARRAKIKFD